jgi:sulfoxide reductase catalytic subunit YedY
MNSLPKEPPEKDITPEKIYDGRRDFLKNAALMLGTATAVGAGLNFVTNRRKGSGAEVSVESLAPPPAKEITVAKTSFDTTEPQNTFREITTYNNYYEFGTAKSDPAANSHTLKPRPWTVVVSGEVEKEMRLDIDDVLKMASQEQRIYRMRCVEAWSMVIPWLGIPLGDFIKKLKPTSKANYVAFKTLLDPQQMPGQTGSALNWPYIEGLRMDEAMNPLTMLATGIYGKTLPNQNGAPLRLVVPWKYGFKGIKAIVEIKFTEAQPSTSWNVAGPGEYGFYANVNPNVPHPRWSQAMEQRIPDASSSTKTLLFNGYGEYVAHMYKDMDLAKNY